MWIINWIIFIGLKSFGHFKYFDAIYTIESEVPSIDPVTLVGHSLLYLSQSFLTSFRFKNRACVI